MNARRSAVLCALAAMLASLLVVLSYSPAQASFPGRNGVVAFNRGGNIYTFNAVTKVTKQVTTGGGYAEPQWSPDGKQLAYRNASGAVFVRTMATNKVVTVATGINTRAGGPIWSGDGTRVAYITQIPDPNGLYCGQEGIYSVPKNGGARTLVFSTLVEGWEYCAFSPSLSLGSWSPDSRTILLTSCSAGAGGTGCSLDSINVAAALARQPSTTGVFGISCDLDDVEYTPGDGGTCIWPGLSSGSYGPSGKGVLFSTFGGYNALNPWGYPRDLPYWDNIERVYSISTARTGLHQVSTRPAGYDPTTSPDGRFALFTQKSGTVKNIMRVTGTSATAVPSVLIKNATQADWQPIP